jgi:hypothetical protein
VSKGAMWVFDYVRSDQVRQKIVSQLKFLDVCCW